MSVFPPDYWRHFIVHLDLYEQTLTFSCHFLVFSTLLWLCYLFCHHTRLGSIACTRWTQGNSVSSGLIELTLCICSELHNLQFRFWLGVCSTCLLTWAPGSARKEQSTKYFWKFYFHFTKFHTNRLHTFKCTWKHCMNRVGVVQPETLFKLADGVSYECLCIYRQIVPDCMFLNANQMCSPLLIREPQCGTDYKSSWVNERGNAWKSGSHVVIRFLAECCSRHY